MGHVHDVGGHKVDSLERGSQSGSQSSKKMWRTSDGYGKKKPGEGNYCLNGGKSCTTSSTWISRKGGFLFELTSNWISGWKQKKIFFLPLTLLSSLPPKKLCLEETFSFNCQLL